MNEMGEKGSAGRDPQPGKSAKGAHPVLFYGTMILVAFIAGILIFNFLILPLLVGRGDIAIVPEIKGMTVSPAEEVCRERGLNLMVTGERPSPQYPVGTVMEQDPASGESLKGNRTVKVIISSGPRTELVPALADESLRQSELLLEASGLARGRIVRVFTNEEGPNRVISSSPAAGSHAPAGSRIDLLLSMTGEPNVYLMPDLTGMDLPFVKEMLERCGFHVSRVVSRRDADRFPNTILSQNPDPGHTIKEGGTIELVVSTVE